MAVFVTSCNVQRFDILKYFEDEKRLTVAPKNLWVSENSILLDKLHALLGADNVKLVAD